MSIPITLICGYLGAGKTTYINKLLSRSEDMAATAVLVNDFGSVNIDAAMIKSQNPDERIMSLTNGCVCCAVQDDLATSLDTLRDLNIQQVILEASGVAAPAKAKAQCHYPGFHARGALVLVAMDQYSALRDDRFVGSLVRQQVNEADLLALTKTEHASSAANQTALTNDMAATLEHAPRFDISDADLQQQILAQASFDRGVELATPPPKMSALTLQQSKPISIDALRAQIAVLPQKVSRVKGWAHTDQGTVWVQGAGAELRLTPSDQQDPGTLVFIFPQALPLKRSLLNWKNTWEEIAPATTTP